MRNTSHFFLLLRYAMRVADGYPEGINASEWHDLFIFSKEQSLLGVMYEGIEKMPPVSAPPRQVLLSWLAIAEQIKNRNKILNERCIELTKQLEKDGFQCCILKGQGNASMYPNPYLRTPGDIDMWCLPQLFPKEGRRKTMKNHVKEVLQYVRKRNSKGKACYHHIDAGEFNGVEVEMHYRPSYMNNLIHNRRIQKWFCDNADAQFCHYVELPDGVGKIPVPTNQFNIIFQLAHLYNHLIHEGIGLRQFVDYFYLLHVAKDELKIDNGEWRITLRHLGLWKFAGAVMYVMREVFALEERYMIAPVDERRGRFLLEEIMQGGNFGQYDRRTKKAQSQLEKNIKRLKRDIRLVRYFPSECLWEPVFRTWHFFWRLAHR